MICVLLYNKIITKNFWLLKAVEYYMINLNYLIIKLILIK